MLIDCLEKIAKRILRVKWWARHGPDGPGAWLYTPRILSWLYKPHLKQQLPPLCRLFATYCALQDATGKHFIIGGQLVFHSFIWLTKLLRLRDYVQLDLGPHTVFLNLGDPRMLQVPNELLNDKADAAKLKSFLSEGDTFVDIGANHGSFSIIAAKLVGHSGLVVAIEPQPRLAHLVEKSLAANTQCKYQVHRIACGDQDGHTDFYLTTGSSGSAGLFPALSTTSSYRKFSVPLKRFDDAVDWQQFPGQVFIKLDIEGSELAFLRGASTMIRARKPHIMLEISPSSMKAARVTGDDMTRYLQVLGYEHFVEVQVPMERKSLRKLDATRERNIIAISQSL